MAGALIFISGRNQIEDYVEFFRDPIPEKGRVVVLAPLPTTPGSSEYCRESASDL